MTQAHLIKFTFKPGKKGVWLDWAEELKRRRDEVMQTLKDEGVTAEACFLSVEENAVYYFMEAKDIQKAREVADKSTHPIDAEHRAKFRESLEKVEVLQTLFHFSDK